MKRKLFTALALCAALMTLTAAAALAGASGTCGDQVTWTLDDNGTLTVSGTGPMDDTMGFTAPWCEASPCITRVVIENGVTSVGECAFYGQTELTSVSMARSVTTVSESAFLSCSGLQSVYLPGVKNVEDLAFAFTGLTTLVLGKGAESVSSLAFAGCAGLTDVYYGGTAQAWEEKGFGAAFSSSPTLHAGWSAGWYKDTSSNRWYYFKADGTAAVGWKKLSGKWYCLDAENGGAMVTGWKKIGSKWYYLEPKSGAMATGWKKIAGKWYYLDPSSGAMVTGWKKLGGKWYYLDKKTGAMVTGWKKISGEWYYFDPDAGRMYTSGTVDGWVIGENGVAKKAS